MSDLYDLAAYMNNGVGNYAQLANLYAIAVADAILIQLAFGTPADVGTAISNWIVTLGAESPNVVPAYTPSPKGRVVRGRWTHVVPPPVTTQANAPDVVAAGRAVLQTKQPGQSIFITNNLDYIQVLDRGSSDQVPAGFVERARIVGDQVLSQKSLVIFGPLP